MYLNWWHYFTAQYTENSAIVSTLPMASNCSQTPQIESTLRQPESRYRDTAPTRIGYDSDETPELDCCDSLTSSCFPLSWCFSCWMESHSTNSQPSERSIEEEINYEETTFSDPCVAPPPSPIEFDSLTRKPRQYKREEYIQPPPNFQDEDDQGRQPHHHHHQQARRVNVFVPVEDDEDVQGRHTHHHHPQQARRVNVFVPVEAHQSGRAMKARRGAICVIEDT